MIDGCEVRGIYTSLDCVHYSVLECILRINDLSSSESVRSSQSVFAIKKHLFPSLHRIIPRGGMGDVPTAKLMTGFQKYLPSPLLNFLAIDFQ